MKRALAVLLLLPSLFTSAQMPQGKAYVDSLLRQLPRATDDTSAVIILNSLSVATYLTDPDDGLKYAKRALTLSQTCGWKKGEAIAFNSFGNSYRRKASYPQALDFYYRSLRIYEDLGINKDIGIVSGNIGTVYFDQKAYPKALESFFKSLHTAQSVADKKGEMMAVGNIGSVYYAQARYTDAIEYLSKSLAIAEELKDNRGIINQLSNIGSAYADMGKKVEGLGYYQKALNIAREEGDRQIIATNEGNIGETYLDIAKDSSTAPAQRAANLASATQYLQKGIADARAVAFNQAVIDFSQALSEAYTLQGAYKDALAAYRQYTALKDSTFNLENNEKLSNLETKRAVELKEKDIQLAKLAVEKKRNERWAYIGGILLLLAIMAILFRSFRRQQHSNHIISKEKQRSDDLLLNILPAEVAEELKDHGSSAARLYDDVSVIFTDFVDFTGTAQSLSPQMLIAELNECFTAFDAIIERNGLEKIKTIGDAYMAVCGLPQSNPLHAKQTVQAAIEIRDFVGARLAAARSGAEAFQIRIGINSGSVVAGIIGVKKFAYDIWGDTVNTAARMEQYGEPGAINISQSTYDLVKDNFGCISRGKISAKNKGDIEMYFVEDLKI